MRQLYKQVLIIVLLLMPAMLFAQNQQDRSKLVNKIWHVVAMRCNGQYADSSYANDAYIHYYSSLKLTQVVYNNVNYGTYEYLSRDQQDNPRETGQYSLSTDDAGATLLTLKTMDGRQRVYRIEVTDHYLTLYSMNDDDKCKVSYAVAP